MNSPKEIEAKYRLDDAKALRMRLVAATAERVGVVDQVDVFYDDGSDKYCEGSCGLRIRRTKSIYADGSVGELDSRITFKGPLESADGLKIRTELETTLGNGDTVAGILASIGFAPVVAVAKIRESWRLDGCDVEIDVVCGAGLFVEVEGPSAEAVCEVCATLELAGEPITNSYASMVAG